MCVTRRFRPRARIRTRMLRRWVGLRAGPLGITRVSPRSLRPGKETQDSVVCHPRRRFPGLIMLGQGAASELRVPVFLFPLKSK